MNTLFGSFWGSNELLTFEAMSEASQWGYEYPVHLQDEIRAYSGLGWQRKTADQKPLSRKVFRQILAQAKHYAIESNAHLRLAYHNEKHYREFATSAILLFDRIYGQEAKRSMLAARQAIEIAGWLHDCHHTGCTLRFDYDESVYAGWPGYASGIYKLFLEDVLGRESSTEYASAYAANQLLTRLGLPLPWRVFIVNAIWATTFGGGLAQARGIKGTPAIHAPSNVHFALMRVADIWYPKELHTALEEAYKICCLELPADGRVEHGNAPMFLRNQTLYLGYRLDTMRHLDSRVRALHAGIGSVTMEGQECTRSHRELCEAALRGENHDVMELAHRLVSQNHESLL